MYLQFWHNLGSVDSRVESVLRSRVHCFRLARIFVELKFLTFHEWKYIYDLLVCRSAVSTESNVTIILLHSRSVINIRSAHVRRWGENEKYLTHKKKWRELWNIFVVVRRVKVRFFHLYFSFDSCYLNKPIDLNRRWHCEWISEQFIKAIRVWCVICDFRAIETI